MIRALLMAALVGLVAGLLSWEKPGPDFPPDRGPGTPVYLLNNGFHTDLAVPRDALERRGGPLGHAVSLLAPGEWVLIGWGDAVFYVDQTPISSRLPDGARAFFRPGNPAVVMLDPTDTDPAAAYPGDAHVALVLPEARFNALAGRVEASLALTAGAPRVVMRRTGDDALFFASRETFSILHLCNHWVSEVLNAGGVAVRPVRSVFSDEVVAAARRAAAPSQMQTKRS